MTISVYAAWPLADTKTPLTLCVATQAPVWLGTAWVHDQVQSLLDQAHQYSQQGLTVVGYVAYEAAPAFDPTLVVHLDDPPKQPLCYWMAFNTECLEVCTVEPQRQNFSALSPWVDAYGLDWFEDRFARLQQMIAQGDFYQLNLTTRLHAELESEVVNDLAWQLFKVLYFKQQASHSVYLNCGSFQLLSLSPEVFFHWQGNQLLTSPMKGTCTATVDDWVLKDSAKNQAENVMIVDLLRNDMARICLPRSVQVKSLFDVMSLPTVKQMTSTITGLTQSGVLLSQVFAALFPCGSVTGAPKHQAMKTIAALEQSSRGVYCGSIGVMQPGGAVKMNVAIRTLCLQQNQFTYGVGSGITWYSDALDERREWWQKSEFLRQATRDFQILETLRLEQGQWVRRYEHLERMQQAARYFGFICNLTSIHQQLDEVASRHLQGQWRGRWLLAAGGEFLIQVEPLQALPKSIRLRLAHEPIQPSFNWTQFKTTHRVHYDRFLPSDSEIFDTLLFDEKNFLCETCRFNVVLQIHQERVTPQINPASRSNLLHGVFRDVILRENMAKEMRISILDLATIKLAWLVNSLREWVPVNEIQDANGALIYRKL